MKFLKKMTDKPIIGAIAKKIIQLLANHEVSSIADHFNKYFLPQLATTNELSITSYNIRHQVYCEELGFEEVKTNAQEKDDFDSHSLACLIKHRETQNFAGTVRIVRSNSLDQLLPLEKYCLDSIEDDELNPANLPRNKICEISRLAVPNQFRRRNTDQHKGAATGVINEQAFSDQELRCFPFIAVGLYFSAASIVITHGIDHCFVMMEPRLARSMRLVGIEFKQIGPVIDYHGRRAPYYIDPHHMIANLKPGFKNLYHHINKSLSQQAQLSDQEYSTISTIINPQPTS